MRDGEAAAQALEGGLKSSADATALGKLFATVSANCKSCHQQFRDVPLKEREK